MIFLRRTTLSVSVALLLILIPGLFPVSDDVSGASDNGIDDTASFVFLKPVDDPDLPPFGFYRGVLPNPKSGNLSSTYSNISKHSQFVPVWGRPSPFYNLSTDLEGSWGDIFVDDLIRGNGMFPLVHVNFFGSGLAIQEPPGHSGSTLADASWRKSYHDAVLDVVNASRPLYLSIGNEVNRWFEHYGDTAGDDNRFSLYVDLYEVIYDDVKEISPETKVFCTFAREMVSENREANLSVLDLFDHTKLDLLVLTSYPHSVMGVNRISDIPDDYYSRALLHTGDMPFGFSEVAWPSLTAFGGQSEQAAFLRNITKRLTADRGMDLELLGWPWFFDIPGGNKNGLATEDGLTKEAFRAWRMNREPVVNRSARTISLDEDFGISTYQLNRTFQDPDPWDELDFGIWNGTAYSNETTGKVHAVIKEGELELTSIDNISGTELLRLRAEDWMGDTNWTFIQLTLREINDPPGVRTPFPVPLSMREGSSKILLLEHYITDSESEISDLEHEVLASPELIVNVSLTGRPVMEILPADRNWFGETYILVSFSDPQGGVSVFNISVNITDVNDVPILRAPEMIRMSEDTRAVKDISGWGTDDDPFDMLTWEIRSNDPGNLTVQLNRSMLVLEPKENWYGSASVHLNLSDGEDFTASNIEVLVEGVNDVPEVGDPPISYMDEDTEFYFPLDSLDPKDRDDDELYWRLSSQSTNYWAVTLPGNDTVHITPMDDVFGKGNFTLVLDDNHGGAVEVLFSLEVLPVNDDPVFTVLPNWTVEVEKGGSTEIDLTGPSFIISDVDNDISELHAAVDHPACAAEGLILNVSLPDDFSSEGFDVQVNIVDGLGGTSTSRTLSIIAVSPGNGDNGDLLIDNITVVRRSGSTFIEARGEPFQTVWIVFLSDSEIRRSFPMEEEEPGSGLYSIEVEGLGFEEGETLTFHLSSEEGGDNDAGIGPTEVIYGSSSKEGEPEEDGVPYLVLAIFAIVFSIVIVLIIVLRASRARKNMNFDYGSILEE